MKPSELLKLIRTRRSIRIFKPYKISKKEIKMLLEAARWAPSGLNLQPWQFIVVLDKKKIYQIAHLSSTLIGYKKGCTKDASCIIAVLLTIPGRRMLTNLGLTMQNICLQAHALGLGSCIFGSFDKKAVSKILSIPFHKQLCYLIFVGKPAEKPKKKRKEISKIAFLDEYGERFI